MHGGFVLHSAQRTPCAFCALTRCSRRVAAETVRRRRRPQRLAHTAASTPSHRDHRLYAGIGGAGWHRHSHWQRVECGDFGQGWRDRCHVPVALGHHTRSDGALDVDDQSHRAGRGRSRGAVGDRPHGVTRSDRHRRWHRRPWCRLAASRSPAWTLISCARCALTRSTLKIADPQPTSLVLDVPGTRSVGHAHLGRHPGVHANGGAADHRGGSDRDQLLRTGDDRHRPDLDGQRHQSRPGDGRRLCQWRRPRHRDAYWNDAHHHCRARHGGQRRLPASAASRRRGACRLRALQVIPGHKGQMPTPCIASQPPARASRSRAPD